MATELKKSGTGVAADTPFGAHVCLFYDTKQDLLDAVVPYFKAGLESGESCLWIVSEPLTEHEAKLALRQGVHDLDRYFAESRIEFIPYTEWYLEGGRFHLDRVLTRFQEKVYAAVKHGCAGLRCTGDAGWLGGRGRKELHEYEQELNHSAPPKQATILCTYPLAGSSAADLLHAAQVHGRTSTMRNGEWEILEAPEIRLGKEEIKQFSHELELRTASRTEALRTANEELVREIAERTQTEAELRRQKEVLQQIFDHIPVMLNFMGPGASLQLVNREWERTLGWTLEELRARRLNVLEACYPDPREHQRVLDFLANGHGEWSEFRTRVQDGSVIDTTWAVVHLSDGTALGIGQDITKRKQSEKRLHAITEQLRALSASIEAAREEEKTRVARLIHDELGSALTSLKWDLEGLDKTLSQPLESAALPALRAKLAEMRQLTATTLETVRGIASQLRPSILDDLGLVEAIEWQAQQFESRTGIVCSREGFLEGLHFNAEQSTAIFRIFQEALTNILRHAQATRVDVTMARESAEFVLTVADNGKGITATEKAGLGVLGMKERARLVGGRIDIHGMEGKGTRISVRVPMVQQALRP